MSELKLRNITNNFQDVRLASLASWKQATEFTPRDRGGPYVIIQDGYDPEDAKVIPDEFILGRSGKWVSLSYFYRMPVPQRRAEFIFGTAGEIIQLMDNLPAKPAIIRPGPEEESGPVKGEADEMAAAIEAGKKQPPGSAS